MQEYFTKDNTEGYTPEQLRTANAELETRIAVSNMQTGIDESDANALDWLKAAGESVLTWLDSIPLFRAVVVSHDPRHIDRKSITEDLGVEFVMPGGVIVAMKYDANTGGLQVRALDGSLEILPDASNLIVIKVNRGW